MNDPRSDQSGEQAGIVRMLLGALLILVVMVGSTLLLVPRLLLGRLLGRVRPAPARPDGYGERPLATPPDVATVTRRAQVLALQFGQLPVAMARAAGATSATGVAEAAPDVAAALAEPGMREAATPDELAFLETRPERLTHRDLMDASWRAESLAVMQWALGRLDTLPPWDTQVDGDRILALVRGGAAASAVAALRPHAEIEALQREALLWHWRSRTRQLEQDGTPLPEQLPVKSYEEIVRITLDAALEDGVSIPVRDDDFKAMGKAFRYLTEDEWSSVRSIIMERHLALNWLLGYAPDNRWDETPTHT
jgi:hypothetical protein